MRDTPTRDSRLDEMSSEIAEQSVASPFGWDLINDLRAVADDENAITEFLLHRLGRGEIYTWLGPLLLVVHPGEYFLRDLFDETHQRIYARSDANLVLTKAHPHIYAVAARARFRVINSLGNVCQVIVISGESGTGKTFNARKALEFLASVDYPRNSSSSTQQFDVIKKIVNVYPLLSAFSTASTERNARSSRHGQLLRLQYDNDAIIRGVCVNSYLLERTRVTAGSSNFEIFYQLIVGFTDRELDRFLLSRDSRGYLIIGDYRSLNPTETQYFRKGFQDTLEALKALDFTDNIIVEIFEILALILHLGNIRFKQKPGEGCTIDLEDTKSKEALKNACTLSSISDDELADILTSTLICPQNLRRKHTTYRRQLKTPEDCRNRLFSICRHLYESLFLWLVYYINTKWSMPKSGDLAWLGILDIFGFECFENNGLEQLCINYTTERLQMYFMEDYLETGQRELVEEGLDHLPTSTTIHVYRERLKVLETIIFSTFNDASQSAIRPNSLTLRRQLFVKNKESQQKFLKIKCDNFVIEHYSCPVTYDIDNLLSRNTDKVPNELSYLFSTCKNKLLFTISHVDDDNTPGSACPKQGTTLGKIKKSLDSLIATLKQSDPHFVRCTKPRDVHGSWANNEFKEQLARTGILDALPLAKCKYPIKFRYEEFYKRYSITKTETNSDLLGHLKNILNVEDLDNSVHVGKRLVFITESIFFKLEHFRRKYRSQCAQKIQTYWRKNHRNIIRDYAGTIIVKETGMAPTTDDPQISIVVTQPSEGCNDQNDDVFFEISEWNEKEATNVGNNHKYPSDIKQKEIDENRNEISTDRISKKLNLQRSKIIIDSCCSNTRAKMQKSPLGAKMRRQSLGDAHSVMHDSRQSYVRNWLEMDLRHKQDAFKSPKYFGVKYPRSCPLNTDKTIIVGTSTYPLFYRNRILTCRFPAQISIKFHTRRTCLPQSHRTPCCLEPKGLEDCLS